MGESQTSLIKSMTPKREWLVRCNDSNGDLSVCGICVSSGRLEIVGPENDAFELEASQIADFRDALHAAVSLAEADLRHRATA